MKEGWIRAFIKDVGEVIGGTTPSTSDPSFWNGNLCWISPAELDGSHYIFDSKKKITEEAVKSKSLRLLPVGTVILSSRAPIGKVTINKMPTYCNQGFKCVICGEKLLNEYLYWWFWGNKDFLNSLGTGATFKEISKKVVENITIPLPPLSEQEEIVTYLDTSFAKIDAIKANAEKELEEAKKLFAAALKRSLSPTLSQGEGDREGQMKTLSEIGESRVGPFGSLLHKKDYIEGGTPLINPMHIVANKVKADYSFTVTDEKKAELSSYMMQKGDIVIGRRGEMGRCAIINEDSAGFICGTGSIFFRPNIKIVSPRYLQILLSSEEAKKKMTNIASGATMLNLSSKALSSLSFLFPPLAEQQSIVTHLDTLSEKVRQLQSNYEKISSECDALKQAILRDTFE